MKPLELVTYRKKLKKTQKKMAQLLGVSIKAVHSYEQGWRSIPAHVERQILFLVTRNSEKIRMLEECWAMKNCPDCVKENCPAWEFEQGKLCWFVNGTLCKNVVHKTWDEKIKICKECKVLNLLL